MSEECSMAAPALHLLEGPQPRVACIQCGILLLGRERWQTFVDGREVSPLCGDCYTRCQPPRTLAHRRYPVPSVTVIVYDASRRFVVVGLRRDNQLWSFPGGMQEFGESLPTCAHREVFEETGLSVRLEGCVCIDSDPHEASMVYGDGLVQYTNVTFSAVTFIDIEHIGKLRMSQESLRLSWFLVDALPKPLTPSHRWRWDQARAHQGSFLPVR
jgi:8-oxo-dGTP pyrophosphatase MutT (NUDIX family)